ncbi:hypothetical protein [Mycobacterium lepromatosis]|uniref:hypothetical protein n=1 Tax=Mycobacterium lepromatosis TaxID=480418 RepID=UPI0012E098B4|nr:hypothetical protein [Mycobacterium lepromatosis]
MCAVQVFAEALTRDGVRVLRSSFGLHVEPAAVASCLLGALLAGAIVVPLCSWWTHPGARLRAIRLLCSGGHHRLGKGLPVLGHSSGIGVRRVYVTEDSIALGHDNPAVVALEKVISD